MIKFIALQRFLSFLPLRQKPYFTRQNAHIKGHLHGVWSSRFWKKNQEAYSKPSVNRILSEPCPSLSSVGDSAGWLEEMWSYFLNTYVRVHSLCTSVNYHNGVCKSKYTRTKKTHTQEDNTFFLLFPKKEKKRFYVMNRSSFHGNLNFAYRHVTVSVFP